jgi:peroxiredoxin
VPDLVQLQKDFGSEKFTVLGIMQGNDVEAQQFITKLGVNYPIKTQSGQDFSNYKVYFVPEVYLVAPDGKVVADNLDDARAILSVD